MNFQKPEDRPPFVTFEVRSVEDRDASINAGMPCYKDVDYAIITPLGSKDRIERVVVEWFANLRENVAGGRFQAAWLREYQEAYRAWKEGLEPPVNGTPLQTWPGITPAQFKTASIMGLRSVEDLATCNEEAIGRLGMGARLLKDKAVAYLTAAGGPNKLAEEVTSLRSQVVALTLANERLTEANKSLVAQLGMNTIEGPVSGHLDDPDFLKD